MADQILVVNKTEEFKVTRENQDEFLVIVPQGIPGTPGTTAANLSSLIRRLDRGTSDAGILIVSDSTGNWVTEWPYLMVRWLAAKYPAYTVLVHFWDEVGELNYQAATTVQTGTGTRTLTVWIAAKAGSVPGYFMGSRFATAIVSTTPNVIMLNHSHNLGNPTATTEGYLSIRNTIFSAVESMAAVHPFAAIVLVSQNPTTLAGRETWQSVKATMLEEIASLRGYGFIDGHQAFIDYGATWADDLLETDGVHPNATGSQLWAGAVTSVLANAGNAAPASTTPSPLLLSARNYLTNYDFSAWSGTDPDSWTPNGSATTAKNTTNYETGAQACDVIANATTGPAQLGQVLSASIARELRGQWVTLAVRVRRPSDHAQTIRVLVRDSVGSTGQRIADVPVSATDGFVWCFVNKLIDPAATSITVWLWARTTGTAMPCVATFDRAYLVQGQLPFAG